MRQAAHHVAWKDTITSLSWASSSSFISCLMLVISTTLDGTSATGDPPRSWPLSWAIAPATPQCLRPATSQREGCLGREEVAPVPPLGHRCCQLLQGVVGGPGLAPQGAFLYAAVLEINMAESSVVGRKRPRLRAEVFLERPNV